VRLHWNLFLFGLMLFLLACGSDEDQAVKDTGSVCAILAHPDDETIISGTLAMLSKQGHEMTIVYVTSGDDGPDMTGRGLHGKPLGEEREKEAISALKAIGIKNPPVFLRYPDSHVNQYVDSVQQKLTMLLDSLRPDIVFGFGPEGITGDWDHIACGQATDMAFDISDSGSLLLHMAINKPFPPFYANGVAVPRNQVDVKVKVSRFSRQRSQVVEAHQTQFNKRVRSAYKIFVHAMRKEKFIIACNRNGNEWLERCFFY
jgi:LmbE family N-acetylglucosaminyl deacetylase